MRLGCDKEACLWMNENDLAVAECDLHLDLTPRAFEGVASSRIVTEGYGCWCRAMPRWSYSNEGNKSRDDRRF